MNKKKHKTLIIANAYKKLENSLCLPSSTHLNKNQLNRMLGILDKF